MSHVTSEAFLRPIIATNSNMKKILFLVPCLIPGIIWAQGVTVDEIPANVMKSFNKKYPSAEIYGWTEDNSLYLVEFAMSGQEFVSAFNGKGDWQYSQTEMDEESLPQKVTEAIFEVFSSPSILQIYRKEARHSGVSYVLTVQEEVMVETQDEEGEYESSSYLYEVVMNPEGEIMAKNSI